MLKSNVIRLVLILLSGLNASGQKDSTLTTPLTFKGFADIYYSYDFSNPKSAQLPAFLYSHASHNQISLNNALLQAHYLTGNVRASIGFHTGTYVQLNYASEPLLLQHVYEAFAGFEVIKNLWFDAGIFSSHLGYESALSKDNMTLTRSMAAENSPYYESGAKLSYSKTEKFSATFLILNGWQRITDNNSNKAPGTQLQFRPNSRLLINSSTFLGNEQPDSAFRQRFFHDLYITYQISPKIDMLALYDIGCQQNNEENGYDLWDSGSLIVRYKLFPKLNTAIRGEFLQDMNGVVTGSLKPFFTKGFSLNLDYQPGERILFRIEGKTYRSNQAYFQGRNYSSSNNIILTVSTSVSL